MSGASHPSLDTLHCEVAVIGAGLVGSSTAMHLSRMGVEDVLCIDFDLEGALSSSELNAGGVRATWIQDVNIEASRVSIEYFAKHAEEVGYRPVGYLWLHPEERLPAALKARERQQAHGWEVHAWDVPELKRRYPFIDKTDGIAGAIFAPRDGLINPNLLKLHFRNQAKTSGARFQDRVWIQSAEVGSDGIRLRGVKFPQVISHEDKLTVLCGRSFSEGFREIEIRAKRVVNCAGAWAPQIAKILKYPCPSYAVRRQVSIFDCRDVDLSHYGMIVDPSGVYFHPEATNGLAGFLNRGEPRGANFAYDGESFFMEHIWPALYERSSGFERLRHLTGWAGLYEVSPDECAILGQAHGAPGSGRIFDAHSFSGHGAMQSYAAGLGIAELMVRGRYETVDFSTLGGDRFEKGREVRETLVI